MFLFVWSSHSWIFSLIWRRHHCRWRAANFDLCSALMAIEQWGFLNVPYPLLHRPTVYYGNLQGHSHLLPSVWKWSCHHLFLRLRSVEIGVRDRGSNPDLPHARRTLYLFATAAVRSLYDKMVNIEVLKSSISR